MGTHEESTERIAGGTREPVGMYGETPRVYFGDMSICKQGEGQVWIEDADGDGGAFPGELVEKAMSDFLKKHL